MLSAKAEIEEALRAGLHWADKERIDMLCKAGGYSDRAYDAAVKSQHWKKVMHDCELIKRALETLATVNLLNIVEDDGT